MAVLLVATQHVLDSHTYSRFNFADMRRFRNFHGHCDALDKIVYDGALWEAVSKLLGLPGGELEIFQSIALLKLAGVGREKPWHQDQVRAL